MDPITTVRGNVSVLDRDDVDTDQILPKQFLKRMGRDGFGRFLFYDWAKEPDWSLPVNPILAAGRNFGCGSSREHAVWALYDYGFRVIIAPSFGDIFYSNCTKMGLLPVVLPESQVRQLMQAATAEVDLRECTVGWNHQRATFAIDPRIQLSLLHGLDDIARTLEHEGEIETYEEQNTMHLANTVEVEQRL